MNVQEVIKLAPVSLTDLISTPKWQHDRMNMKNIHIIYLQICNFLALHFNCPIYTCLKELRNRPVLKCLQDVSKAIYLK